MASVPSPSALRPSASAGCNVSISSSGMKPARRRSPAAAVAMSRSSSHVTRNRRPPSGSTATSRGSSRLPAENWNVSGSASRPSASKQPQFAAWNRLQALRPCSLAAARHTSGDTSMPNTLYACCTARNLRFSPFCLSLGSLRLSRSGSFLAYVFPSIT